MKPNSKGCFSKVSIVIPAYNAGATLAAALTSVVKQTVQPLEIIVVDDGSTDDTREVIGQFGDQIRILSQSNGGLAAARRTGIAAASGEFIALFDADDICEPDRLALQQAYMDSHQEVLLCATDFGAFDENGTIAASFAPAYYDAIRRHANGLHDIFSTHEPFQVAQNLSNIRTAESINTFRGRIYEQLMMGNFIHPPTVMFRRSVLGLVGNFDIEAGVMCDWDWILQVSRYGEIAYLDRPLLQYRISATQMSAARYRYGRAVGNMLILERLRYRDPEVYLRLKSKLDSKMGSYCLDAADAICEENQLASLHWLIQSAVKHRYFPPQSWRILAKALLPTPLRDLVKQARRHAGSAA